MDITLGISFISWMAAQKMTQSQVTCFSSLMPSTRTHLMLPFDATYPSYAFQMSSARSALNYLLNAQHQIALIGAPSSTNPAPRKITTKDSVWVASNYASVIFVSISHLTLNYSPSSSLCVTRWCK